ncbi:Scr1 family TA system antitoxin-like transcriptional regulator [Amycolatopsis samaneae]|uniref:Scr1 family TA system antitoxin-like transcriptional regulator n=1 Tax=Amycolatopsis samaneae TaxID=664691 RepID=A0ABW5GLU7_9PSEU
MCVGLRAAREAQKITYRQLSARTGIPFPDLALYETGRRAPRAENVARIVGGLHLGADEGARLLDLARQVGNPDLVDADPAAHPPLLLEYEHRAAGITAWAPDVIPAPLQTPDYVEALGGEDERVVLAASRQHVLSMRYRVLLGERALRQFPAARDVRRHQLHHLLKQTVPIQVVPDTVMWPLPAAFACMTLHRERQVIVAEHNRCHAYLTSESAVAHYRHTMASLEEQALPERESRGVIAGHVSTLLPSEV